MLDMQYTVYTVYSLQYQKYDMIKLYLNENVL